MDVLKILLILFISVSCSRVEYITKQGVGQVKLLTGAVPYSKALKSNEYSSSDKEKIRKIQEFKSYFYKYFALDPDDIYSKVYKLKQEAVTYLVIASPYNEIKAKQECFPFVGCFPYLGFFSKDDAVEYFRELENKGEHVWIRPVYAYSTLGNFTDPILSSFFYFDDYQLANLIFHELFHTIFFVDDQVDLNENLANFFADQLTLKYFESDPNFRENYLRYKDWLDQGMAMVTKWGNDLNRRYKDSNSKERALYQKILGDYQSDTISKDVKSYCQNKVYKSCWLEKLKINNASLAAYMTYEKDSEKISNLFTQTGLSLKEFFSYIKSNYKQLL